MNFNIYLDDRTGKHLTRAAARSRMSRNALIRKAVRHLLEREARPAWPQAILDFQGDKSFPKFESHRSRLRRPPDDPLA